MKNNGKVGDVHSLACKTKVLNGRVPGTWKWTIDASPYTNRTPKTKPWHKSVTKKFDYTKIADGGSYKVIDVVVRKIWPYTCTRPLTVIWTDMGLVRVRINPLIKTWNFHDPLRRCAFTPNLVKSCLQLLMQHNRQRNDKSTHPWCTFCQIYPRSCISPLRILILVEFCRLSVYMFFSRVQRSHVTRFHRGTHGPGNRSIASEKGQTRLRR